MSSDCLRRRKWEFTKKCNSNNHYYENNTPFCVNESNSMSDEQCNDHLAVDILEFNNKTHEYVKTDCKADRTILDHISKTASLHNVLHVNPPCFTVDKFMNTNQTNSRDYKEILNTSLEYTVSEKLERFLMNNKKLIEINVIDKSHIPLMHFESSVAPVVVNIPMQYNQKPIITDKCSFGSDILPFENETFQKGNKNMSNISFMEDFNPNNVSIQNQLLKIRQCNSENIINMDNNKMSNFSSNIAPIETNNDRMAFNKFKNMEFQRPSIQAGYIVKSHTLSEKNIAEKKRKPNYRELINKAHALRSAISENDLNMQIIKRTLNYKQSPTNNISCRNIAVQSFKKGNVIMLPKTEKNSIFQKSNVQNCLIQHQGESSIYRTANIAFPLDLSIKTYKHKIEKPVKYEGLNIENGCPPKYNFKPNFLENHKAEYKDTQVSCLSNNNCICNRSYTISSIVSNNNISINEETNSFVKDSKLSVKTINDIHEETELKQNRKRTFSLTNFVENLYSNKKTCLDNSFYSESNGCSQVSSIKFETKANRNTYARLNYTTSNLKNIEINEDKLRRFQEPESNLLENNQNVFSANASRIRTKAELKEFVFQDEFSHLQPVASELKKLDFFINTCQKFVDQLYQGYDRTNLKNTFLMRNLPLDYKKEKSNFISSSYVDSVKPIQEIKTENFEMATIESPVSLDVHCENNNLNGKYKHVFGVTNSVNAKPVTFDSVIHSNKKFEEKENAHSFTDSLKKQESDLINKEARIADLKKLSVVRLKKDKYFNRILEQSEEIKINVNNIEKNQNRTTCDTKRKSIKYTIPSGLSSTKQDIRNTDTSLRIARCKKQNMNIKAGKVNESNFNNIKTRLRTQVLKSKKSKVDLKLRLQNKTKGAIKNSTEQLYLEVYRYKRALNIPPNLITINSKFAYKVPNSSTESNSEQSKTYKINNGTRNCYVLSRDNVPKSIIDLLHSRVVKPNRQSKSNQRYLKHENQSAFKSKCQEFRLSNIEQIKVNKNNNAAFQEKRNVFETEIIPSRTRMEHKMQLNKEVIREIFKGEERTSSASSTYDDECLTYFQKLSDDIYYDLNQKKKMQNGKNGIENDSKCVNVIKVRDELKKHNQCNEPKKINRRKKNIIHKRRISSGLDYLRKKKKKKSCKCALYNCSRLNKRKITTEENLPCKNESDILKEIQKWVLNKGVGQSVLHKAVKFGYIDVIVYCLEKMGLRPDHKDNAGYTPLHDACVNGYLDITRVLLQYGANHSESAHSGIRPIHEASENGHIEIVRMLLSYGADPLLETYSGQTPLMLASDPNVNTLISMHLNDMYVSELNRHNWNFHGPWNLNDKHLNGSHVFDDIPPINFFYDVPGFLREKHNFQKNVCNLRKNECDQNLSLKNIFCGLEFLCDAANTDRELFEFEEAASPLPPLYLLKDEGMEKWVLLSDLCSVLKVKSKDTLLHKIFPTVSPANVSRLFLKELKMFEFLEKATCLQLLCAGEKLNICHSKVVLIRYNENVRKLLGVNTILMKL